MISSLHIIGSQKLGGAEKFYTRLVNALHENGQDVGVICPAAAELLDQLDSGVPRYPSKMRSVFDLVSRWQINRTIKKIAPDIVQTYMGRATRLTSITSGKGPVHIARLGGFYNLKAYRHAHAWVGNTKGICDYLVKNGLPADRVFHINNFVDEPLELSSSERIALMQQLGISDGQKVVLSVGRLHTNKAFDTLLKATRMVVDHRPSNDFVLVIVGDGPERENLHRLSSELQLAGKVLWAGWQDPAKFYNMADLFICPSRHEPLGNVILEAWSNNLAVISTRTQGPLEFTDDDENAILVPIDDPTEMAAVMEKCLELDELRKQLGNNGRRKIIREFSKEDIVRQYLDVYRSLIPGRNQ